MSLCGTSAVVKPRAALASAFTCSLTSACSVPSSHGTTSLTRERNEHHTMNEPCSCTYLWQSDAGSPVNPTASGLSPVTRRQALFAVRLELQRLNHRSRHNLAQCKGFGAPGFAFDRFLTLVVHQLFRFHAINSDGRQHAEDWCRFPGPKEVASKNWVLRLWALSRGQNEQAQFIGGLNGNAYFQDESWAKCPWLCRKRD